MSSSPEIRNAAFEAIAELVRRKGEILTWSDISKGFEFQAERVFFANKAVGIFKPAQLNDGAPLSLRSSRPSRPGREPSYEDLADHDGTIRYKLQGTDPENHFNRTLKKAWKEQIPLIYFFGLADATYDVIWPVFVAGIDESAMEAVMVTTETLDGSEDAILRVADPVRRYKTELTKTRLHQAAFRFRVLTAYANRCALTGLPVTRLLDAAHILPDRDVRGRPAVENGLCLSRLHHAAYDTDILGIDPDGKIHVNREILKVRDGPLFDVGLKALEETFIRLPANPIHHPNRDYLAERFEIFSKQ